MTAALAAWTRRRWLAALVAAAATTVLMGVPTALIPTPVFGREVPPTAWAWPVLLATSVLSGLLLATYVREPGQAERVRCSGSRRSSRSSRRSASSCSRARCVSVCADRSPAPCPPERGSDRPAATDRRR